MEYIQSLPADVAAKLGHAALWRNGIETVLTNAGKREGTPSLEARLNELRGKFDTLEETEEEWH